MKNKYKLKNKNESVDIEAEVGDIKDAQRENGQRETKLERVIEWAIYLVVVFLLAWIVFDTPVLK